MEVNGQLHCIHPVADGEQWGPLNRSPCGPQKWSGRRDKKIFFMCIQCICIVYYLLFVTTNTYKYIPGADKSLARSGRKPARKHVRRRARFQQHQDASYHQVFLPARQGAVGNSRHSDRSISLFPSWSG